MGRRLRERQPGYVRCRCNRTSPPKPPQVATATTDDTVAAAGLLAGANYLAVLGRLHTFLQPERYLEIGTNTGRSLALAKCSSIAVDPRFKVEANVIGEKPRCLFYQMPSDRFFRDHSVTQLLGGPVDLAFLDGLHQYEFLLRDFYNTEQVCRPNSIIALHDSYRPISIARAAAWGTRRRANWRPSRTPGPAMYGRFC